MLPRDRWGFRTHFRLAAGGWFRSEKVHRFFAINFPPSEGSSDLRARLPFGRSLGELTRRRAAGHEFLRVGPQTMAPAMGLELRGCRVKVSRPAAALGVGHRCIELGWAYSVTLSAPPLRSAMFGTIP